MIKSTWTLEELMNLKLEKSNYIEYNSGHPFVAKVLLVPYKDDSRGYTEQEKLLYGGILMCADEMFKKHGFSIYSAIIEGPWDTDNDEHVKLYEQKGSNYDIIFICKDDKPVVFLMENKNESSNPLMYVLDESEYYRMRNIIASMVETWNDDDVLAIDNYTEDINSIATMYDLFEHEYDDYIGMREAFVVENNKLKIIDNPNDEDFDEIKLKYSDICNLDYQSITYGNIPFHIAERISAVFNKIYPIEKYKLGSYSAKEYTEEYDKYGEKGFNVSNIMVCQYLHCVAEDTDPEKDYIYVIKSIGGTPIMMITSGLEWYDIKIFDEDKFMSLWVELMYTAGKYKLVPEDMLVKDPSKITIDLSQYIDLDNLDLKDNQIINTIVPE